MYNINSLIFYTFLLSTFISSTRADLQNVASNVSTQIVAEGGVFLQNPKDKTHLSREHVTDVKNNATTKVNDTISTKGLNDNGSVTKTSNKTDNNVKDSKETKPVVEEMDINAGVSENVGKSSVGKKGVSFSDTDSAEYITNQTTSAIKSTSAPIVTKPKATTKPPPVPKKPLTTQHDEIPNDSQSKKPEPDPKLSNMDAFLEKKSNRANYVIPIVAVILSVPLVAIIISVLYKRGQDWWQHRNYRRMDFLIEGMYNN